MREFFRPFRRKVGVLVLVGACAIVGLWIRSLADSSDFIEIRGAIVVSDEGVLHFGWKKYPHYEHPFWAAVIWVGEDDRDHSSAWLSVKNFVPTVAIMSELARIPHWSLALPLTLLSACLLLSKPKRKHVELCGD